MAKQTFDRLSPQVLEHLQGDRLVLLVITDAQSGTPSLHALSWVVALNDRTVALAASSTSSTIQSLRQHPLVSLAVFAQNSCLEITCNAVVLPERVSNVTFPVTPVLLHVQRQTDIMHFGVRLVQEPATEVTYDRELATRIDGAVFSYLRGLKPTEPA